MEMIGRTILAVEACASTVIMLVAYQAHARNQTLDFAVVLTFALGHTYGTATLLVGALLPMRVVYERSDLVEMMHRSRYLVFDCVAQPCALHILLMLVYERREDLGISSNLLDQAIEIFPTFVVLAVVHATITLFAAKEIIRKPMITDNCLNVMYYRLAGRITAPMRCPCLCSISCLWILGVIFFLAYRSMSFLVAAAVFNVAYSSHITRYVGWYFTWEIYVQPLAAFIVSVALLQAMNVSLHCDWRRLDPTQCLVYSPKGTVPLLRGLGAQNLKL
jgi:hypothetical protein